MDQMENNGGNDFFKKHKAKIRVVENMRSFENDPVFLKKKEEAYKALEEVPLPEHLVKRLEKD